MAPVIKMTLNASEENSFPYNCMSSKTPTKRAIFSTHADPKCYVPEPETMPEEDAAEATLELTLLAADGLKGGATFLGKTAKPFAVAWVDPALINKSPIPLHHRSRNPSKLHLPLSLETIQNPSSSLTVQIVSSRLPFCAAKPVASAAIPLSSLPAAGKPFALPLRRPSGRAHGSLRLSARILWYLAPSPPSDPGDGAPVIAGVPSIPAEVEAPEFFWVEPSAPPLPAPLPPIAGVPSIPAEVEAPEFFWVEPSAPPLPAPLPPPLPPPPPPPPMPRPERIGPWRSFFIGLASGTVAVVLMGAAGLLDN